MFRIRQINYPDKSYYEKHIFATKESPVKNVLVIGGFGFLGRYIAGELIAGGYNVSVCDIKTEAPAFDTRISIINYNFVTASDDDSLNVLRNFQSVVFCGGRDDRSMPDGDAWDYFYNANVVTTCKLTRLASDAGVDKLIILGSYFAHFDRKFPKMKLSQRHPYIRSRVEQEKQSISEARSGLQVIILEIPYVFGSLEGVVPLWKSLVNYIYKTPVVMYTTGGTAFISVRNLAQAVAGAITYARHGDCIPVAGKNMTWKEMIKLIASKLEKKRPVLPIAWWIIKPLTLFVKLHFKIKGIQSGLDPYHFIALQSRNTYLDVEFCTNYLKFRPENLDSVFDDTVKACLQ